MADFLWHKVSEKEKEEIRKQAKSIMDSFSHKLSSIDKKIPDMKIRREKGEREEGAHAACNELDREIMFENAPNSNRDFIVGEKKTW